MIGVKERPEWYSPRIPDPLENRCPVCNKSGFNRTGLVPTIPMGSSTDTWYARRCPKECKDGWKE